MLQLCATLDFFLPLITVISFDNGSKPGICCWSELKKLISWNNHFVVPWEFLADNEGFEQSLYESDCIVPQMLKPRKHNGIYQAVRLQYQGPSQCFGTLCCHNVMNFVSGKTLLWSCPLATWSHCNDSYDATMSTFMPQSIYQLNVLMNNSNNMDINALLLPLASFCFIVSCKSWGILWWTALLVPEMAAQIHMQSMWYATSVKSNYLHSRSRTWLDQIFT